MASTHPQQADSTGQITSAKVLTAGFNSPVPECTLQVSSQLTKTHGQNFTIEQKIAKSPALGQRSWFDRLLEIF